MCIVEWCQVIYLCIFQLTSFDVDYGGIYTPIHSINEQPKKNVIRFDLKRGGLFYCSDRVQAANI